MEDQRTKFEFVETLHRENGKQNQVIIGSADFPNLPQDTELRKGIWCLCYDHFEHDLKEWTTLVNNGYYDELKLPIKIRDGCLNDFWLNSIRDLISCVRRIHSKRLYHGGLHDRTNYVFVDKCLKIINIKGSLDEFESYEKREKEKKKDITGLLWMSDNWFESIVKGGKRNWPECDAFFKHAKYVDTLGLGYKDFVDKVEGHPFLLSPDDRMHLFDVYESKRIDPATCQDVKHALTSSDFDKFKNWNSSSTLASMDSHMLGVYHYNPNRKSTSHNPNHHKFTTYGGSVKDLLRYLRNLNHHYHEQKLVVSMEDVDRRVRTQFGGFLEQLYKHL
ncbi:unnamed protein product [Prunus armeniaca]